ncbi:MAG: transketolase [Planctomycetota bacterium]
MNISEKQASLAELAIELRKLTLKSIYKAGSGHCGGALSAVEILTVLYFDKLNIDPSNPCWEDRDRFIASKGHCAPALYASLAKRGFFPEDELHCLRKIGHFLQGHPDMKKVPGVDMSTGSLGLGLSVGIGMALAAKLDKKEYYTYVLLGCGEHQEGQVWEAAMTGAKYKLSNLIAIVDYNGVQLDGLNEEIMPLGDLQAKWQAFGWKTIAIDGHNITQISNAIDQVKVAEDGPWVILANTVKGKGIDFMEGKHEWHGKAMSLEDYVNAMSQLGEIVDA